MIRLIAVVACGLCLAIPTLAQRPNYPEPDQFYDEPAPAPQRAAPVRTTYSRPSPLQESAPKPTPVPILKQINKHNEDGSYTYGYEGADGSFKIETKLPTGEVMGKYGYVDDVGKVRVVEYGANRYGFMPAGEGITVAPPTLVDDSTDKNGNKIPEPDYDEPPQPRPAPKPKAAHRSHPRPAPAPIPVQFEQDYQEEEYSQPPPQPQQQQHHHRPVFAPVARPDPPSFENVHQTFGPPPTRQSYSHPAPAPAPPRPSFAAVPNARPVPVSLGPTPPRPQIHGGAPVPNSLPAPVYEEHSAPRPAPARLPLSQRAPAARSYGGSSILDQLAKDYALPSGGAGANVDISFSSY